MTTKSKSQAFQDAVRKMLNAKPVPQTAKPSRKHRAAKRQSKKG